jgi:anti-sigma factor ChrR (cupin superfamily)
VSSNWRPDDSLLRRDAKGQYKAAKRVRDALRKNKVQAENRITTSRDPGMAAAQRALKRTGMPTGVQQWQLPVAQPLDNLMITIVRMKPDAMVPMHAHKVWVFRFIIQGSLKYGNRTLKPMDWMLVPPGQSYSITAGPDGCTILYGHCSPIGPPPPGPGV